MTRRFFAAAALAAVAVPVAASAAPPPPPFSCSVHYTYVAPGVGIPSLVCYG